MKKYSLILIFLLISVLTWSGGEAEAEAAASPARGKYLAGQGLIIPSKEVHIDSYIAYMTTNTLILQKT